MDGWDVLGTPDGDEGGATFTLNVPFEDEYALMLRAKRTDAGAGGELVIGIDGQTAGTAAVADEGWSWIAMGERRPLAAGEHTVTVGFPAGDAITVHSVLLTNR